MEEEIYVVKRSFEVNGGHVTMPNHKYVVFGEKPLKGAYTYAGFLIIEDLLPSIKKTRKLWYKEKNIKYVMEWVDPGGTKQKSIPFNYLTIAEHLRLKGKFVAKAFNLPDLECNWLDESIDLSVNIHKFNKGETGALILQDGSAAKHYGESYPIVPQIDREGHVFSTFQP